MAPTTNVSAGSHPDDANPT